MIRRMLSGLAMLLMLTGVAIAQSADSARAVLHLLDYIAVDYPGAVENGKIANADEYQEMLEFTGQVHTLIQGLPDRANKPSLLADAAALAAAVEAKAEASTIAAQAGALRRAIIGAYDVQVAPRSAPDLTRGKALYAAQCAACHGANGLGDGPAGKGLDPAPSNFHDQARMAQRSVYALYNTITLGVEGTAMAPYGHLRDEDRWALAFFVANFPTDQTSRARGQALWREGKGRDLFPDLGNVAALSPHEARERFGDDGAALHAFLRSAPQTLAAAAPAPIDFAVATIARSIEAYREGRRELASQLAIQAYLEGFELVETSLQNIDAALTARIEREMMAYRSALAAGAPLAQVERDAEVVTASLEQARAALADTQLSPVATFISALVILVREGVEAILVVAAILAFTRRAGRANASRWVHVGWVAALALGLVTWFISNHLVAISGASREMTEGVTALVAAAMLLYVGYWLHSKSNSQAWQKFIGDKVSDALSAGTVRTLGLISFLAVYREAFETVLFYQALAAQAGPQGRSAWLAGLALGAALLIFVAWAILRASVKLPIRLLFSASGVLLIILAVVFTGQGVAALQEAGQIGSDPVGFVHVPMLGIYPTLQTLGAQAVAILGSVIALRWAARSASAKVR
ncbi:MAG: FTR1 family protein [Tepidimonas sp.]